MERFGEKISAEACSGKDIAGLLKNMMREREPNPADVFRLVVNRLNHRSQHSTACI